MTTGEKIKLARKRANLSQKLLGEMVGVSQQAIGQYEADKSKPTFKVLKKIAVILEDLDILTVDYLSYEDMLLEKKTNYDADDQIAEEIKSFELFLRMHRMEFTSKFYQDGIGVYLSFDNSVYELYDDEYLELHTHIYNITKEIIRIIGRKRPAVPLIKIDRSNLSELSLLENESTEEKKSEE